MRVYLLGYNKWQLEPQHASAASHVTAGHTERLIDLVALERVERVTREIDELRKLADGWDTYDAPALNVATLDYAVRVFARVASRDVPLPAVVPTVNGGIQFEWHTRKADVEIEVVAPGEVDVHARPRSGGVPVTAEAVDVRAPELMHAVALLG